MVRVSSMKTVSAPDFGPFFNSAHVVPYPALYVFSIKSICLVNNEI